MTDPVLELAGVTKDYHGLRPLRIQQLTIHPGEGVALLGFDALSAEVFINLVNNAIEAMERRGRILIRLWN